MCGVPITWRASRSSRNNSSLVPALEPITPMDAAPYSSAISRSRRAAWVMASGTVTSRDSSSLRTTGRRTRSDVFQRSKLYRPRSHSHISSTSGLSRDAKRRTSKSRLSTLMLHPYEHSGQMLAVRCRSQGRETKRYFRCVSAPTGQTSGRLPWNFDSSCRSSKVATSVSTPRCWRTISFSPVISS